MDTDRIERDLRFLKLYALITTTILGGLALSAFRQEQQERARFTEIDVERINVREPNGDYRMVISNRARSIGPIFRGKPFGYPGGTRPGIIFFNDEGTENGGLTFSGKRDADGTFRSTGHLSFDQYEQDQVVYLQYVDNNGQRRMGLTVADRADVSIYDWVMQRDSINKLPDGQAKTAAMQQLVAPRNGQPLFAQRAFVGRDVAKNAVVNLADRRGKTRLRLVVDSLGAATTGRRDALSAEGFRAYQGQLLSLLARRPPAWFAHIPTTYSPPECLGLALEAARRARVGRLSQTQRESAV
jgi:hypothetical protein